MQNLREKLLKAGLISEDQRDRQTDAARGRNRSAQRNAPAEGGYRHAQGEGRPRTEHERAPRTETRSEHERAPRREARSEHERRPRSAPRPEQESPTRSAPIPKLPPLAVPNNKELQRLEAKKQLELERRIRELVASTELAVRPGDQTFYFVTRKNRLRRIELTPELARKLEAGELAVVERPEPDRIEHSLVPASTADRILELSTRAVRFYNRKDAPVGFLSDEELSRRQRAEEDDRASAPEPLFIAPDEATGFGDPFTASETQHLAAAAEREAALSSSAED
jgi:uncharacterized protein YaiL (DUF2058 family)